MPSPEPIIRIIRPQLTPEEREARMNELKRAVGDFWIEVEKAKRLKGAQNAPAVNV